MAENKEGRDVEIIRNVLSVQHVPVVGTLAWDKLQFLLHSLCDRISSQAARLEKAEEQGKNLASFKEELNLLCQNALTAAKADKELEAQKQAKFWEVVETRLKTLEELMAPFKDGSILAQLGDMPKRVSVVEVGLQETNTHISGIDSQVKQIDSHVHQMDNDLQELDSEFTNKESREGGMDTTDLTQRIKLLEAQIEEFQELMNQITKAHTADLEAIQRTQRTLRSDLEAKAVGKGTEGGGDSTGLAELQKRLERKVDVDVVEQLLRASTNTKDGLEALTRTMDELKKRIRKSARFSVKMDGHGTSQDNDSIFSVGGGDGGRDDYEPRVKKLEDELAALASKLSAKADRVTIDEIQFKLASGGGDESSGGGGGSGDSALKDLIAKKVDRPEMLELMNSSQGGGNMKELLDKINVVNSSVVALAERSDLAVLLAKRAEQIAHPVAMIQGASGHADDEEIQLVVNEHANRIMVYADMLLQMQVVLATKVDNLALSTLREIVDKMQAEGGGASKVALEAQEKIQEQMKLTIKSHEKMLMKLLEDVGLLGKGVLIMSGHDDEFHPDNILPSPALTTSIQGTMPSTPVTPNSTRSEGTANQSNSTTNEGASKFAQVNSTLPRVANALTTQITPTSTLASPPSSPNVQATSPIRGPTVNFAPLVIPALAFPPAIVTSESTISKAPDSHVGAMATLDVGSSLNPASRKRSLTPIRKASRFGSLGSTVHQGSVIHITNIQEASQVVAESKYHETLSILEDAINAKKLEPKENVAVLKRLVLEVEKMSIELEKNLILIDNLEQNKVDKIDFQALAKIVKELKAMENAMLSSKPILGFKCMSCNHDLERLSPTRGPQIPTGQMPRSFLSMLSAERIFSMNKRDISPIRTPPLTPPANLRSNESLKVLRKKNFTTQSRVL